MIEKVLQEHDAPSHYHHAKESLLHSSSTTRTSFRRHGDKKEEDTDRCTPNGEVCLYNHICYNTNDYTSSRHNRRWETTNNENIDGQPLLNNIAIDHPQKGLEEDKNLPWFESYSQCNEHFQPVHSKDKRMNFFNIDTRSHQVLFVDGTTYYVCSWINHFGHILFNMITPAFHALTKIGVKEKNLGNIKFLIDEKTDEKDSRSSWKQLFSFVTGGGNQGNNNDHTKRVFSLSALQIEAKSKGKRHICFEKLLVGMYNDNLLIGPGKEVDILGGKSSVHKHVEVGQLQSLRNHLHSLYPASKESVSAGIEDSFVGISSANEEDDEDNNDEDDMTISPPPPECTITLLEKKQHQGMKTHGQIMNRNETLQMVKQVFEPSIWKFQSVSYEVESTPILSQYMILQSSMVHISVSDDDESHMIAMFLPDGGFNIQLNYSPDSFHNNDAICGVIPTINCFHVDPPKEFIQNKFDDMEKEGDLMVDLKGFRVALQKAHDQLWPQCQIASNKRLDEQITD